MDTLSTDYLVTLTKYIIGNTSQQYFTNASHLMADTLPQCSSLAIAYGPVVFFALPLMQGL